MIDTSNSNDLAEERTEWAEERTDWAEDRTIMANERTFAAWVRTGLASVGIGLGFSALFNSMEPLWIPKLIATGFMLIGIFLFWSARRNGCAIQDRLQAQKAEPIKTANFRLVTGLLAISSASLAVAIWVLKFPEG